MAHFSNMPLLYVFFSFLMCIFFIYMNMYFFLLKKKGSGYFVLKTKVEVWIASWAFKKL